MRNRPPAPHFVGRTAELGALTAAVERAAAGQGATVIVGGEAGVGKSRLVRQFVARLDHDRTTVLVGACVDCGDAPLPFGPLVEAIRPLAGRLDVRTRQEALEPLRAELDQLLPRLEPAAGESAPFLGGGSRSQLFEAVLGLLERLAATRPVVLVVEDLHWADRSTRDLLAFLVPNLAAARVCLVLTWRSDELADGHPFRRELVQLARNAGAARITVPRFEPDELSAHLRALASRPVHDELVTTIWNRSQGNPFYAEELLAVAEERDPDRLPESLRDILISRLATLSPVARHLVRRAGRWSTPTCWATWPTWPTRRGGRRSGRRPPRRSWWPTTAPAPGPSATSCCARWRTASWCPASGAGSTPATRRHCGPGRGRARRRAT